MIGNRSGVDMHSCSGARMTHFMEKGFIDAVQTDKNM